VKVLLRTTILLYIFLFPYRVSAIDDVADNAERLYSVNEVREDFSYLYETLQISSYDLFLNTKKPEYDSAFRQVLDSISGPMSLLEVSRLFQPFVILAGFSHCALEFPSEPYRQFYQNGGHWFPFEIIFQGDKVLIAANWSENENIEPGDEILTVDGIDIQQLIAQIFLVTQGENEYAKRALLEIGSFMDRWWYVFGDFRSGTVGIRKHGGQRQDFQIEGIDLAQWRQKSPTVQSPGFIKDGRAFKFIGDVAYLRPGIFLNKESRDITTQKTFDNGEFLDFIESVFTRIAGRGVHQLIIDIRGNNGGDNSFSDPMIAYFANQPFRIASKFSVRTSEVTKSFWKDVDIAKFQELKRLILSHENGTRFDIDLGETMPRNDELSFTGNVVVLIDRFSFSNAAVVAAIVQDYGFGTLVGEETSYTPSSCAAIHQFNLPNTNISAVYPKACSIRPNGDKSIRGVVADHVISDNLFTEEDEILTVALKLIEKTDSTIMQ